MTEKPTRGSFVEGWPGAEDRHARMYLFNAGDQELLAVAGHLRVDTIPLPPKLIQLFPRQAAARTVGVHDHACLPAHRPAGPAR